jgi:hypothetical protein
MLLCRGVLTGGGTVWCSRQVAIDSLMRAMLSRYSEKPQEGQGQAIGGALIGFTMRCRDRVAALYDPILGYRPCKSQVCQYEFHVVGLLRPATTACALISPWMRVSVRHT